MSDNRVSRKPQDPTWIAREEYIELVIKRVHADRKTESEQFVDFAWDTYTKMAHALEQPYGGFKPTCTYGPRNDGLGNCRGGLWTLPKFPPHIESAIEFMRCAYFEVASERMKDVSKIISHCDEEAQWPPHVRPTTESK